LLLINADLQRWINEPGEKPAVKSRGEAVKVLAEAVQRQFIAVARQ
jgi:hypothetical protein